MGMLWEEQKSRGWVEGLLSCCYCFGSIYSILSSPTGDLVHVDVTLVTCPLLPTSCQPHRRAP